MNTNQKTFVCGHKYSFVFVLAMLLSLLVFNLSEGQADAATTSSSEPLPQIMINGGAQVSRLRKAGQTKEYEFTLDKKAEIQIEFYVKKGKNKKNAKLSYELYKQKIKIKKVKQVKKKKNGKKKITYKKKKKIKKIYYETSCKVRSGKNSQISYVLEPGNYHIIVSGKEGYRYILHGTDVTKKPVKLKVLKDEYQVKKGKTKKVAYDIKKPVAEYVSTESIDWQSSDETIATVEDGVIKGISPGKCKIFFTLDNGESYKVKVKVPALSFDEKVYYDQFAVGCSSLYASADGNSLQADINFINRFKKKTVEKVVFSIYQYNAKGKRIKSGEYSEVARKLDSSIAPGKYVSYSFYASRKASYVRVCVKKITFSHQVKKKNRTWKSSYHKKWKKKYGEFYDKKSKKAAKKAAKKKKK